jgi:hypothetical protein
MPTMNLAPCITIEGSYWDSYIYKGRLFLFRCDGSMLTIKWDRASEALRITEDQKLAFSASFTASDLLYSHVYLPFLKDKEIYSLLVDKFERLAAQNLVLNQVMLNELKLGEQDTPFPFPHAESEVYYDKLYVASQDGVHSGSCHGKTKFPVSTRSRRLWDSPCTAVSAGYGKLAVAAGSDGLHEISVNDYSFERNQLLDMNCVDCEWAYYSIFASSHTQQGGLAAFEKLPDDPIARYGYRTRHSYQRNFKGILRDEDIFLKKQLRDEDDFSREARGYSWGVQDKLCKISSKGIHVVRYQPWLDDEEEEPLQDHGFLPMKSTQGGVVSAATAPFGIVIEYDRALALILSDGRKITIPGEPVSWKVFPRAKHYQNQLHIIYEDRLMIYSFNHDYIIDQNKKTSGTCVFQSRHETPRVPPVFFS